MRQLDGGKQRIQMYSRQWKAWRDDSRDIPMKMKRTSPMNSTTTDRNKLAMASERLISLSWIDSRSTRALVVMTDKIASVSEWSFNQWKHERRCGEAIQSRPTGDGEAERRGVIWAWERKSARPWRSGRAFPGQQSGRTCWSPTRGQTPKLQSQLAAGFLDEHAHSESAQCVDASRAATS